MSVEYRDNSGTVFLITIIAEGSVSAAESWKDPVSSSIEIKSDDGWHGGKGTENESRSGRKSEAEEWLNEEDKREI